MGFSMITEVGEQLVDLLTKALVPDVIPHAGSIGMCSPADHGDYNVGIYLYDVNPSDDIPAAGMVNTGIHSQTYPSTFLTLDYMITAYSTSDLKFRASEEQKILGRIVQALGDARLLPVGSLGVGASMNAKIEMCKLEREEKMRMWVFPDTPYKLSLYYRVHPVEITSTKINSIIRVRDIDMLIDKDRVFFNTSLVVLPIDAFTGRPITGSGVSMMIEGEKPPVVKDDGFRVFTNIKEKKPLLKGISGLYAPVELKIDMENRDSEEILVLRMMPSRAYPLPEGTTTLEIKTTPNRSLKLWTNEVSGYRLTKDYKPEDGKELNVYNPTEATLDGKGFFIGNNDSSEWMRITNIRGKNATTEAPLKNAHPKTETLLWPADEITADDRGICFLPISIDGDYDADMIKYNYIDSDGRSGDFSIELGRDNLITLD